MSSGGSNPVTHLNRQYGIMDSLLFNDRLGDTKFWYEGYHTERPKHAEYKDLLPQNKDVSYDGQPTIFEIPIYADKLGGIQLSWIQGPLTTTGGTYRRFSDWLGLDAIKCIIFRFGPNEVFTHFPDKLFYNILNHMNIEKQASYQADLAGFKSQAERNALALLPQEIIYDIPFAWTKSPDRYQEIRQLSISPVIEVYWKALSNFVQTDGTAPVSLITNPKIIMHSYFLEAQERDANTEATETEHGIVRLAEESAFETSTPAYKIPAGTTGEWGYELKNYKTSLRFLAFWIRTVANLTTPLAMHNYELDTYFGAAPAPGEPDIKRFRLVTGAGEVVFDWVGKKFNQTIMHRRYYNSSPGSPVYFYSWDDNPMDENNAHGSYNFQALQNPMLYIDFGTVPTTEDMYITVMSSKFNMIQTVRGEVAKQFN